MQFLTELTTPVYCLFLKILSLEIEGHNLRLQIKGNHLVVKPKQEAVPKIDTKILIIRTPID